MAFSDDYASTFSGDEKGDFLDAPDVVRQSPTTTERVVDTQSGYLVVVKRVDTRFSLSVKRRLGTPPSSAILLTPDESIKLSRILGSVRMETRTAARSNAAPSSNIEGWLQSHDERGRELRPELDFDDADTDDEETDEAGENAARDSDSQTFIARRRNARRRGAQQLNIPVKTIATIAAALVLLPVSAFVGYKVLTAKHEAKPAAAVVSPAVDVEAMEAERVNKFARTFVSDMLDFSPTTYRVSQVHAMSNMSPELLETYWKETHFPLTADQLKSSPQGTTLMITKVDQARLDEQTRSVDIYAELVSPDSKLSNPVHLQLKVATGNDGQLRVLEQKDLSAKK